jgi:hypothetical protein
MNQPSQIVQPTIPSTLTGGTRAQVIQITHGNSDIAKTAGIYVEDLGDFETADFSANGIGNFLTCLD